MQVQSIREWFPEVATFDPLQRRITLCISSLTELRKDGFMDDPELSATAPRNSSLATVAGITGLLSFFFGPAGLLAVLLGHIALFRINRSHGLLRGRGLCIFALIMGYLAIGLVIYHRSQ